MIRRETYETAGPLRLRLELPVGRIDVETVDGTTTHVELEAASDDMRSIVEEARIDCRERGNGHEVTVEVQPRFGIFISFGRSQDIRLRVTCPPRAEVEVTTKSADLVARGRYGNVEMKTASGDADIDDVGGEFLFKSASGDVHVARVGGGGRVQTASGDVAIDEIERDLSVQLVSGDLWVRDAHGSLTANTVSGDQRIDAVDSGTMELRAVSGDLLIGVRRGSRVYVDANTVSGSTSSELDLSDGPPDDADGGADDATASLVEIRAKTVSGDIQIVRAPARSTSLPAA